MLTGKNPLELPHFMMEGNDTLQDRLATLDRAIKAERMKRTPEELPLYDLICTHLLAQDPHSRISAKNLVVRLESLARLHSQGLYLKMSKVTGLLVEEQRETLLDYIPLQVTVSPLQEDPDRYWERREKEEKASTVSTPAASETKKEEKSEAIDATAVKASEGDAPQALEANFDRFLADPNTPVLVLFGEGGLGKSLSTYQLAQGLLQAAPWQIAESKLEGNLETPKLEQEELSSGTTVSSSAEASSSSAVFYGSASTSNPSVNPQPTPSLTLALSQGERREGGEASFSSDVFYGSTPQFSSSEPSSSTEPASFSPFPLWGKVRKGEEEILGLSNSAVFYGSTPQSTSSEPSSSAEPASFSPFPRLRGKVRKGGEGILGPSSSAIFYGSTSQSTSSEPSSSAEPSFDALSPTSSSDFSPTWAESFTASEWLPIFIRPGIQHWAHSQLHQGLQTCLKTHYHLNDKTIANLKQARLLFILDGYDELQIDIAPQNLPTQLGLADFPNAKLIVTSRHSAIKAGEEVARFGPVGRFTPYYLLPLPLNYLLVALEERLSWEPKQKEDCAKRLQESTTLRVALRNPFVLNLFVQSWDTLSQEDFNNLTRVGIYEGFIRHWLTTQQDSITEPVKQQLKGVSPDLITSFYLLAGHLAFDAYRQNILLLENKPYANDKIYPWLHLNTLIDQAAAAEFSHREQSNENRNRALLKQEDYLSLMRIKGVHFMRFSPLQQRANEHWNFVHKSYRENPQKFDRI